MTEFDDTLSRLFAKARQHPPAEDFLEKVAVRMSHARRRRAFARAALATVAAAVAIAVTPYVAMGSLAAARHLGVWLPAFGDALTSPIAWVGYLAVAAWSIRRARHG